MPGTRERMVISTVLLMREKGARATSIDDVLAHSGAPRGSVYHHFPGGRDQLLREATGYAGSYVAGWIERSPSSVDLLDDLLGTYREQLLASDFRAGCPIVAAAVEADSDLQEPAAEAFGRWSELIVERLRDDGVDPERAAELATLVVSSIEGALVIARARRDPEPLETVHRLLRSTLLDEIPGGTR